ncbi:MAG: cytochrome c5 family protein [Betaproteobacteria bacterium]|nr:cytochrome c5 family protein [Betaproteobacteria bacterium]
MHGVSASIRSFAPVAHSRFGIRMIVMGLSAALGASIGFAAERTGAEVVKSQCARCHDAGTAGAPKPGDKAAWAPRFSRGVDALVYSAIRGHGGMPPRGGKADLTDAELRNAVLYLFNPAGPPKEPPKGAQGLVPTGAGPQRVSAGGLDIYLGRVSAEQMRAFPAGSPEAKAHGGIPSGSGYHHVNVTVFDSASQAQLTGASVELDVEQVGMGRETKTLEPATVTGGVSYGTYVRLAPKVAYVFVVRVRKAGATQAVEATFQERPN